MVCTYPSENFSLKWSVSDYLYIDIFLWESFANENLSNSSNKLFLKIRRGMILKIIFTEKQFHYFLVICNPLDIKNHDIKNVLKIKIHLGYTGCSEIAHEHAIGNIWWLVSSWNVNLLGNYWKKFRFSWDRHLICCLNDYKIIQYIIFWDSLSHSRTSILYLKTNENFLTPTELSHMRNFFRLTNSFQSR